jgi:uncharacterized MAPEG superfamily protein
MMTIPQALVWSAILTWLMLVVASLLRSRGWTPEGMQIALGNRDDVPAPTALSGRADRAAANMLEALAIFTAIAAAVFFSGKAAQAQTGAAVFFWARLAYWPCYLAGIVYLRTAIWAVSVIGVIMMILAMR